MNKEKLKGIVIGCVFTMTMSLFILSPYAESIAKHIRVVYPNVNLVVNNQRLIPKDSKGDIVEPFIYNDTTYLPVRAIGEALNKDVTWDDRTKTIRIEDRMGSNSKPHNSPTSPQHFLEKNKALGGKDFVAEAGGTVRVNQADFSYSNRVFAPLNYRGFYNIDGKYSKMRGVLVHGDKGEGMYGHNLLVNGDGKNLFNGSNYLKSKGFANGLIPNGDKNQPIEFEIDLSNISLLELDFGYYATIYNLEFIK